MVVIISFDRESRASNQHMLMLRPGVLEIEGTLTDNIEIFSRMKHFFLVLGKENRDHLLSVSESILPIMIVKVSFYVLLTFCLVFSDYELIERIFKDSLKDPLAKNLEVRLRTFLKEKFK
jgi:hypothetical protein